MSLKWQQQFFNASTDTPHIPLRTITPMRFLDASSHLYKSVYLSVGPSVRPLVGR